MRAKYEDNTHGISTNSDHIRRLPGADARKMDRQGGWRPAIKQKLEMGY
jgi:hypothetical protein